MEIDIVIIILFSISALFFLLSFFKKDSTKELEKQFENFTMTTMQEFYQLKKKIQILEEELLANTNEQYISQPTSSKSSLLNEVISYYEAGYPIEKIAELTTLSENEVINLLSKYERNEMK